MGVSASFFQRRQPGELCPLAQSAVDTFMFKGDRLFADPEGFVRYAQVIVRLENRRAVEVLRVGFFQHRVLEDGTLDRDHFDEIVRTMPDAALGGLLIANPMPGLIDAEHRFARRRLKHLSQWTPTQAEIRLLRELVIRRVGRRPVKSMGRKCSFARATLTCFARTSCCTMISLPKHGRASGPIRTRLNRPHNNDDDDFARTSPSCRQCSGLRAAARDRLQARHERPWNYRCAWDHREQRRQLAWNGFELQRAGGDLRAIGQR